MSSLNATVATARAKDYIGERRSCEGGTKTAKRIREIGATGKTIQSVARWMILASIVGGVVAILTAVVGGLLAHATDVVVIGAFIFCGVFAAIGILLFFVGYFSESWSLARSKRLE